MKKEDTQISMDDYIARIHASGLAAAFVVTGAGSSALYRLLACPGASRTVLEAEIPYHAEALARYLGAHPAQAVSEETAVRLAERAYHRSVRIGPGASSRIAGVACTAALATDRERRGEEQAYIAVCTAEDLRTFHLRFEKGGLSRADQEEVVGRLLLHALGVAAGLPAFPPGGGPTTVLDTRDGPRSSLPDAPVVVVEADGRVHTDPGQVHAVLAASLNPLHAGHLAMAAAAETFLGCRVDFEVSLVNADKEPINPPEALRRIQALAWRRQTLATRAPTFVEKARLFPGCWFLVGFDTARRVVQSSFYAGSEAMFSALDEIRARGNRFLVGGRLQDEAFLGLDAVEIPPGYQDLFEQIPERAFREDISSTAIRMAQKEHRRSG